MAISLAIVEKLGPYAIIDVTSELNEGSCFSFVIFKDVNLNKVAESVVPSKVRRNFLTFLVG